MALCMTLKMHGHDKSKAMPSCATSMTLPCVQLSHARGPNQSATWRGTSVTQRQAGCHSLVALAMPVCCTHNYMHYHMRMELNRHGGAVGSSKVMASWHAAMACMP